MPTCPPNWSLHTPSGKCFRVGFAVNLFVKVPSPFQLNSGKTVRGYAKHLAACKALETGATLASIHGTLEQDFIRSLYILFCSQKDSVLLSFGVIPGRDLGLDRPSSASRRRMGMGGRLEARLQAVGRESAGQQDPSTELCTSPAIEAGWKVGRHRMRQSDVCRRRLSSGG